MSTLESKLESLAISSWIQIGVCHGNNLARWTALQMSSRRILLHPRNDLSFSERGNEWIPPQGILFVLHAILCQHGVFELRGIEETVYIMKQCKTYLFWYIVTQICTSSSHRWVQANLICVWTTCVQVSHLNKTSVVKCLTKLNIFCLSLWNFCTKNSELEFL